MATDCITLEKQQKLFDEKVNNMLKAFDFFNTSCEHKQKFEYNLIKTTKVRLAAQKYEKKAKSVVATAAMAKKAARTALHKMIADVKACKADLVKEYASSSEQAQKSMESAITSTITKENTCRLNYLKALYVDKCETKKMQKLRDTILFDNVELSDLEKAMNKKENEEKENEQKENEQKENEQKENEQKENEQKENVQKENEQKHVQEQELSAVYVIRKDSVLIAKNAKKNKQQNAKKNKQQNPNKNKQQNPNIKLKNVTNTATKQKLNKRVNLIADNENDVEINLALLEPIVILTVLDENIKFEDDIVEHKQVALNDEPICIDNTVDADNNN